MPRRSNRRSSSRNRSRSGRSSGRRSPQRRRSRSRKPKRWAGVRYRKFNPDAAGFNPETLPAATPQLRPRNVPITLTVGRNPQARQGRNAFVSCFRIRGMKFAAPGQIGREHVNPEKCYGARNARLATAAALRAAANAIGKRAGAFAALNFR